ncbi:putative ABC transporter C family member 15 [Phragmites australis]|uniref:putative ABC transporter C family member 15 n=1 Tax=Phragmites australis TaxID=29695 RepID=UPI002D768429|nr:putative ABC transporter C family member 15 [Phragmites australis]
MEIILALDYVRISAFAILLVWIIAKFVKLKKRQKIGNGTNVSAERKGITLLPSHILAVCSACITLINIGFAALGVWKHQNVSLGLIFASVSWFLVTLFSLYCKHKGAGVVSNWPAVLVSWWVFSFLLESLLTSLHLLHLFNSATIIDFTSLPFCTIICLCLVAIAMRTSKTNQEELNQPLLVREDSGDSGRDRFSSSGWWSQLTFQWLNPVFEKGRKVRLELEHIPSVPQSETAEHSYALLQETLHKQKPEPMSLQRAIICAVWTPLVINAVFAGLNTFASYMGPFLITYLVELLSDKNPDKGNGHGYILACLFFASKTIESLSQRQWYFGARRIGFRVRAALMVSIYKKSLLIKNSTTGTGKIVNFLDVDVEKIGEFFLYIHGIWLLPLQVSLALVILCHSLGMVATLSAIFVTVLVMVSNTPLAKSQKNLNVKIMEAKDSRIKATAEALKSMRILKLHAWETAYLDKLLKLRDVERGWLRRYLYTCSAIAFLFWASPTLVSVVTFGICILVDVPLSVGTVLSALATFRILQDPIYNLPELVSMVTQTKVSLDRIEEFIKDDHNGKPSSYGNRSGTEEHSMASVEIAAGEYSWEADNILKKEKFTLKIDSKVNIMKGHKVAVCGSVGSGKSSLLCAIMSEIPRFSGSETTVVGSRAYVPQSAWIQTGTIQDNVLFGKAMDKTLYDEVIQGCALDKDVELWANGDMTVVGERGMNLSGGQKQRIQLARALYSDADVYLLDDPFSAVDAHTGAHLFKECLMRQMSSKTVIYVTHQLEFLRDSDLVLVMKNGRIVQSGKYDDLIVDKDGQLSKQMDAHNKSLSQVTPAKVHSLTKSKKQKKQMELTEIEPDHTVLGRESEEERVSGRVKWGVYRKFVTSAYRGALIPVILACQVLFQALQICSNYWIAWASERQEQVSREKMIGIFVLLSAGSSAFILGRAFVLSTIAIETAQQLFLGMTKNVFRAPVNFFESTPSSRILNRASTDQSTVDIDIPYRLAGLIFALIQLISIIFIMSQIAWPIFFLFIIIISISTCYQSYYISSARELARLVGIIKAPVLHHFSETVSGSAIIRCFNQGEKFFRKNLALIDDYSCITFHNSATIEWLCVRINFLFNLVFFVMLVILVSLPRDTIDPSLAGLAATYGLNLNVLQAWVIWNLCNVENKMISVERILQFSNIPSESPLVIEEYRPTEKWPWYGSIQIDGLQIKYNHDMPMVLKGISCTFPGERKIGVVGRTGSGKSTLIQALFRIVEPSAGRIIIDGVDISLLGLHDLRSRLSIIPQEPTLFQGTVRSNLDPLQQHMDTDIWEVVRKCRIEEIIREDNRLLDAPVVEDGGNWSGGQRQLVCLARVLLMKRKILVLDEATASVDTATDNIIQRTIRQETKGCTVISIAHRIPTVIDSDLVLVLGEGRILEYDSPDNLLRDGSSAFSKLVMEFVGRTEDINR